MADDANEIVFNCSVDVPITNNTDGIILTLEIMNHLSIKRNSVTKITDWIVENRPLLQEYWKHPVINPASVKKHLELGIEQGTIIRKNSVYDSRAKYFEESFTPEGARKDLIRELALEYGVDGVGISCSVHEDCLYVKHERSKGGRLLELLQTCVDERLPKPMEYGEALYATQLMPNLIEVKFKNKTYTDPESGASNTSGYAMSAWLDSSWQLIQKGMNE